METSVRLDSRNSKYLSFLQQYSECYSGLNLNSLPKILSVTLLASLLLFVSPLSFAQKNNIGVAAIVKDVLIVGKGAFKASDSINEGDELKIGSNGSVTILFKDESMLMLGPNGYARFDVYEENNNKPGRSIVRVLQGSFRYFPGNILASGGSQFIAIGDRLLGQTSDRQIPAANNPAQQITSSVRQKNKASTPDVPAVGTGGLSLFATGGLTGHVSKGKSQFKGAVNIYSRDKSGLSFHGTANPLETTSLVFGPNSLPNGKDLPINNIHGVITPDLGTLGGDFPSGADLPPGLGGGLTPGLGGGLPPGLGGDLPPGLGGDLPPRAWW